MKRLLDVGAQPMRGVELAGGAGIQRAFAGSRRAAAESAGSPLALENEMLPRARLRLRAVPVAAAVGAGRVPVEFEGDSAQGEVDGEISDEVEIGRASC